MKLELLIGDSKGNAQSALAEAFRHIQHGSIGFIGPSSSGPTKEVSRWLSIPSIDRAVIGYSATSSELSDSAFSNFVRTPPTDDIPAKVMAELMKGRSILRSISFYHIASSLYCALPLYV